MKVLNTSNFRFYFYSPQCVGSSRHFVCLCFWFISVSLLLWNKHWLFNSKGRSVKETRTKATCLFSPIAQLHRKGMRKKKNLESCLKGWDLMFTSRCHCSRLINSFLYFFCHVEKQTSGFNWTGSCWSCSEATVRFSASSPARRQQVGMLQHYMDSKCTSDICLRTCRGHSSHSSEVSVCRGLDPHPRVTSADFSHTYLPVKSFIPLITGQWLYQQTASGVFSTCFLHRFYGLLY